MARTAHGSGVEKPRWRSVDSASWCFASSASLLDRVRSTTSSVGPLNRFPGSHKGAVFHRPTPVREAGWFPFPDRPAGASQSKACISSCIRGKPDAAGLWFRSLRANRWPPRGGHHTQLGDTIRSFAQAASKGLGVSCLDNKAPRTRRSVVDVRIVSTGGAR